MITIFSKGYISSIQALRAIFDFDINFGKSLIFQAFCHFPNLTKITKHPTKSPWNPYKSSTLSKSIKKTSINHIHATKIKTPLPFQKSHETLQILNITSKKIKVQNYHTPKSQQHHLNKIKNTKSIPLRYKFGTLASYSINHSHNTIKSVHSLKGRHSISTLSSKINSKPWNQRYNREFWNKIFCLNILSFNKLHIKILICTFKYEQSLMQIKSANKLHSITYKPGENICLIFIFISYLNQAPKFLNG